MRLQIVIDDALMDEALAATGAKTKRGVVELALRELVLGKWRNQLITLRGIRWRGDLTTMRTD